MKFLVDKTVDLSHLIENQFPQFVREDSSTFIEFIKSYYQSQELKNQPLDIAENLIEYYNVSHYRKSELIEKTSLTSGVSSSATVLPVKSTKGFPEKGYLSIDNEIIYYGSKDDTNFRDCVRGTSALILESIPLSEVVLKTSISDLHESESEVVNVAYNYTSEFLRRIKTEIAIGIPENLVDELELSSFLTNVRSFYASKGSLNSHRLIFRILFNDKKIRFKLKNRGSGATIKIINFAGSIGNAQVTNGGSGYDSRTLGGSLISPPIVEIFGSGTGVNIANKTAVIEVRNILSSNGSIELGSTIDPNYNGIAIADAGQNYVGPITAFVREKDFGEEEIITSVSGNGSGIVESWDFNTNELTLKNIIGFFSNDDELVSSSGEQARGYVQSFEFISQDPDIEFPKDYLLRPSSSNFVGKKIARIEIISGSLEKNENDKITPPEYLTLVQKQDTIFGLKSVSIESSSISKIDTIGKLGYEIDIDINDDYNDLYLPASTQLTHQYNVGDAKITVDDATGFPVTNGIVYIDGFLVEYKERTANQFLDCTTTETVGSKIVNTEVVSYGRYKTRREYSLGEYVEKGQERYYGNNLYLANTSGKTSATDYPSHDQGTKKLGKVEWSYVGDSKVDYFLTAFVGNPEVSATGSEGELEIFVDNARNLSVGQSVIGSGIAVDAKIRAIDGKKVTLSLPNTSKVIGGCIFSSAVARVTGLVGSVEVESGGALFSNQIYEFDGKEYKDFTGIEYTSWNLNSDHLLDADGDYKGITSLYDKTDSGRGHVYVSSSAIPTYYNSKNRVLNNTIDGYTNAFLTGLTSPVDQNKLFVFRNAVLQDSGVDFTITNNIINFNTVPNQTEELYLRYFSSPNQLTKLTATAGSNTSDIVLNNTSSLTRDEIFIFLNGVLQVGSSFTWNDSNNTVTFTNQVVNPTTDDLIVFSVSGANVLDSITTTSSLTYTLQDGGSNFTTSTTDSVIVAINGVVQKPTTSYTISGSTLTLNEVNSGATLTVIECGSNVISTTLTTLNGINLDRNNYKLQKLFKRIPYPSSILNKNVVRKSKSLTPTKVKKAAGITIDGIQYQSIVGNTTGYGAVESITIDDGGIYFIPYNSNGTFNKTNYPKIFLKKNGGETADIMVTENIVDIAGSITKINFNLIEQSILQNLTGFTVKPKIEVINNNPTNIPNPENFSDAVLDVSYKNGNIDNIIIVDSGYGYTEAPTIRISGGGKFTTYDLPFQNSSNGEIIVQMTGPLISTKSSSNQIDLTTELGSSFVTNPVVTVDGGSGAVIYLTVSNGRVVASQITNSGNYYYTEPELQVISASGLGSGAVLRPVLSNGKIIDVNIINPGSGYIVPPIVSVNTTSTDAVLSSKLKQWSFNIANRFITGVDNYGGYVFDEQFGDNYTVSSFTTNSLTLSDTFTANDIIVGMEVSHPLIPVGSFVASVDVSTRTIGLSNSGVTNTDLIGDKVSILQGDDRIRGSLKVSEVLPSSFPESRLKYQYLQLINTEKFEQNYGIVNTQHSKIVGWSYDGHPIYCKYGYLDALDSTSGIAEQTSSYRMKGDRINGPSINEYPLGSFVQDFEYVDGYGTLDQYNGRFCVTPEFPDGAYCYFMVDTYPHVFATEYFSDPDCYNLGQNRTNDRIPEQVYRLNDSDNDQFPEQIKNINKTLLKSFSISSGSVDSIFIENKGTNYKTGDYLEFDNGETSGSGAIAYVSSVESPPVINAIIDNDKNEVEFEFSGPHNLSSGDVVYINLNKATSTTIINLDTLPTPASILGGKQVYTVNLESNKLYRFTFGAAKDYNLSFDSLNFNPYHQRSIVLTSSTIDLDPDQIPSKLFIHTDTSIFELNVLTAPIVGRYVVKSSSPNKFVIGTNEDINNIVISELDFNIRSRGATGPIKTINIVNGGSGYRSLPEVTGVKSDTGTGAILSASSISIGRIKNIGYISYGDQFYGSRTVRNYLKLPITLKIKSNFEISDITIKTLGQNYLLNPYYRINGQSNLANLKFRFSAGEVVGVEILDGGSGFSTPPTLELFSQNGGSGATFDVKIRRKSLNRGDYVTTSSGALAKIVNIDTKSSTLELLVESGDFQVGDTIISSDQRNYGVVVERNSARAHAKADSYGNIREKFDGTLGFLSDDFQRLEDNVYYQDWSYTIANERNTKEWRKDVVENTHPAGFRLFGKSRISSRKSLVGRSQNIVRSAVTFKATISSLLNAAIGTPDCKKQIIWIDVSPNPYQIYDLIYGTQSEAIGLVTEVGDNYIIVNLFNQEVEINEFIINVLRTLDISRSSETNKTLMSVNGILQEPTTSYTVSGDNVEPTFPIFPNDEINLYLLTSEFTDITPSGVNAGNQVNLTVNGISYTAPSADKLLISLNGVIQRNTNFNLVNNSTTVEFTNSTIQDTPNFILYHPQLTPLSFTGSAGTVFDLGFTPADDCQLLIFFEGINQSYLLTDYSISGSTITFSQSVDPTEIFGWYIDEAVDCENPPISTIYENQVLGKSLICNEEKNVKLNIYSDTVKKPRGFFEFEKETLDGTAFVDGTTMHGFGTRFQYSNPEYSNSHVEVINDISSQFDGTAVTFDLKINQDDDYTPWDGENSLLVEQSGSYVPKSEYSVSGSQITFVNAPTGPMSIRDFKSTYIANDNTKKGAELDQFNVFNGVRTRFNTSDNGVPSTSTNNTDVFSVKNGVLLRPDTYLNLPDSRPNIQLQTVSNNTITFNTAPILSDEIKMLSFNRQLVPDNHRNWVYDRNEFFDGVRTDYTLLHDNTNNGGFKCEELRGEEPSEESLVVIRNGVYQYPTTDYTLYLQNDVHDINNGNSTHRISFVDPPRAEEDVFILFHEYDAANFEDRTDELTQPSSTVLSYTTAITNFASKVPFVYVDGVYQDQDSYVWDGAANTLTFSGADLPDLSTQDIEFHAKTGTLNPANVYGDILSAWLLVLQRGANSTDVVKITTTNNTYDVVTRSGTVTISGLDVVTVQTRTGTVTMSSEHYLINLLNLNGNIMHDDPANNFVAFDGVVQEPGVAYDHSGTGTLGLSTIGNTRMYDNMTIPQGIGYLAAIDIVVFTDGADRQYMTNEINQVYDGSRTRFRVTLDGVKDNTYTGHEDLIVSKNNVILEPDVDYHLTNTNGHATDSQLGCIDFTVAPVPGDEIFTIMMHENEKITLTAVNSTTYNLSRTLTAVEQEGLILIQNDQVQFANGKGFQYLSGSQIQFNSATTTGTPFGILTQSGTVLDYINTPYNGTRTEFNLFLDEENFVPAEKYDGTSPHPENIVVYKNGTILTPVSDYTLDGTINSRIKFTTAPLVNDLVYIFTHGVMKTLDSITATSATTYDLTVLGSSGVEFNFASGISGVGSDPNNTAATNTIGTWNIVNNNTITWTGNNSGDVSYFHVPNVLDVGSQYTVVFTVTGFSGTNSVGISQIVTGPSVSAALGSNGTITRTFTAQSTDLHVFGWYNNSATLNVQLTKLNVPYYADALIGRPRELENQLLITSNGLILDPREDYYILGDKINFTQGVLTSGDVLRIRDYYGEKSDVEVESYGSQVAVGDLIQIPGESEFREVTAIHSPSTMSVTNPTNTTPSGFAGTVNVSGGTVTGITVTNGGLGYPRSTKLKTYGLGTNASANVLVDPIRGDVITTTTIDQNGWNISNPVLVPTYEVAVVREQLLSSSDICFGTKLTSNITDSDETIGVVGTSMAFESDITVTVSSTTGAGAVLQPFVVNGKLTKVEIENGGSGYNDLDFVLSVNNGGGTGAVLEGVLDSSGTITSITVINEGVGYDSYRAFIDTEVIEYTNHNTTELKGVTRGVASSTAASHTQDTKVIFAECEQP